MRPPYLCKVPPETAIRSPATCGSNITINPDITSGINAFSLVYGSPANPIYTSMPMLNCPITVNCGGFVPDNGLLNLQFFSGQVLFSPSLVKFTKKDIARLQ